MIRTHFLWLSGGSSHPFLLQTHTDATKQRQDYSAQTAVQFGSRIGRQESFLQRGPLGKWTMGLM